MNDHFERRDFPCLTLTADGHDVWARWRSDALWFVFAGKTFVGVIERLAEDAWRIVADMRFDERLGSALQAVGEDAGTYGIADDAAAALCAAFDLQVERRQCDFRGAVAASIELTPAQRARWLLEPSPEKNQ